MTRSKRTQVTPEELVGALAALFSSIEVVNAKEADDEEKPVRRSRKTAAKKKPDNKAVLKELSDKFKKQFSLKELKELLDDVAGETTVADIPDDMIDDVIEELKVELDDESGDDNDEESEVTAEAVKNAVQAYQKKNGKEDTEELLENYGIKTVRSLGKLEQDQLEDLYADVTGD